MRRETRLMKTVLVSPSEVRGQNEFNIRDCLSVQSLPAMIRQCFCSSLLGSLAWLIMEEKRGRRKLMEAPLPIPAGLDIPLPSGRRFPMPSVPLAV